MRILLLFIIALTFSCKSTPAETPLAEEPAPPPEVKVADSDSAEAHEIEIGDLMYAISRRFANIWYAGEAGNAALVKYQTHEIEEIVEKLEKSGVREGKTLLGEELTKTVVPHLEEIETAVEAGDMDKFRAAYDAAMTSCNSCHVQTGHPYLVVIRPTDNSYPNLKFAP